MLPAGGRNTIPLKNTQRHVTSDVQPVLARGPPGVHDHICIKLIKIGKWYLSQKKTTDRVGWEGTEGRGGGPGGQGWRSVAVGAERGNRSSATNELRGIQ